MDATIDICWNSVSEFKKSMGHHRFGRSSTAGNMAAFRQASYRYHIKPKRDSAES